MDRAVLASYLPRFEVSSFVGDGFGARRGSLSATRLIGRASCLDQAQVRWKRILLSQPPENESL